jgi:hypothetical protein
VARVCLYNFDTGRSYSYDTVSLRYARMRHRIRSWASLVLSLASYTLIRVTLTYRDVAGWSPNDIRDFLRAWCKRYPWIIAYAWVAELQRRGAPHYHIIFVVPKGRSFDSYPDSSGLWTHGHSNTEFAYSPYYLIKYVGKEYQKDFLKFPKGMRAFAVSLRRTHLSLFSFRSYWHFRLSSLSGYFRELFSALASYLDDDDLRVAGFWKRPRGGGVLWDGLLYRSPWVFLGLEL